MDSAAELFLERIERSGGGAMTPEESAAIAQEVGVKESQMTDGTVVWMLVTEDVEEFLLILDSAEAAVRKQGRSTLAVLT